MITQYPTLLITLLFFTGVSADTCYDASRTITNGEIICEPEKLPTSRSILRQIMCKVVCNGGYIASPYRLTVCTASRLAQPYSSAVFEGRWRFGADQTNCSLPTRCPVVYKEEYPENGELECWKEGEERTCVRKCNFPYLPSEPDLVRERCGPDTEFFWTHVQRHNDTKMPPCQVAPKCRNIEEMAKPVHGRFVCREESWARSIFCQLECDRTYVPVNPSASNQVFCGPSTAYRWSNEWVGVDSRFEAVTGCKQSPISAQVILQKGCDQLAQRGRIKLMERLVNAFHFAGLVAKNNERTKLTNRHIYCESDSGTNETVFLLNFEDRCVNGTCIDACDVMSQHNVTGHCQKMCEAEFMNTGNMLNQLRNVTLHYIAAGLAKAEVSQLYSDASLEAHVKVADIKYEGTGDPYGPGSPFCRKP